MTIGDVLFAFGNANLTSEVDRNVDKLADFLLSGYSFAISDSISRHHPWTIHYNDTGNSQN